MIGHIHTQRVSHIDQFCDSSDCKAKVQASCFNCSKCYCFKCSLSHVQSNKSHELLEIKDSLKRIVQNAKDHLKSLHNLKDFIKNVPTNESQSIHQSKLHPQKFQQQLDQITFMKKETLGIVQKFFSEISLQIVNIWENYLKKYSGRDGTLQIYNDLENDVYRFIQIHEKTDSGQRVVKQYFARDFQGDIKRIRQMIASNQILDVPNCPQVIIEQKVLVEIAQLLCSTISTKNYSSNPLSQHKINITRPNYLQSTIKCLPIFPIKKSFCYLYDLTQKVYQIQQFDKLQILPSYPKSILLPNGDLHIIGGLKADGQSTDTHIVYRSSTSEIFKLGNLPILCNPSNSLLYRDGFIYIVGGHGTQGEWITKCFSYNLKKKEWQQLTHMHSPKPHQSAVVFNDEIYIFGVPEANRINIERYSIVLDKWEEISIQNLLSNPFNFAAGFMAVQINSFEVLLYGGKKFIESPKSKKRSTDRVLSPNMYLFRPENNSFVQLGALNPCLGVQYGQINPIVQNGSVYCVQFLVSRNQPIVRWYETMQITQLGQKGTVQSVMILHED